MPPEADDKSRIEELKRSLYSRNAPDVRTRRKLRFNDTRPSVQENWGDKPEVVEDPSLNQQYEDRSMSFLTKILIGSAIFCVIALGVGAYLFFNGSNLISANNIDISISGPVSIPGGEPVTLDIGVVNKNNVELQTVDMSVDFPAGTTQPADSTQELRRYQKFLGTLAPGQSAQDQVSAIIFGEENMQKQVLVTITYSIKGSTSVFTKTKTYSMLINSSPISMDISSYKEISSGQEFDMTVKVKSNSQQTLKSVLLKANFPFGYTFLSANYKPLSDNATWKIGDLPPGGQRTIVIHGKLQGENSDTRSFRFMVGAQDSNNPSLIGTEYLTAMQDLAIQKPFITLAVLIEGDQSTNDYIGQFDKPQRLEIDWSNNLPNTINNVQITVHLAGTAYDKMTVMPDLGYFKSVTDDLIWNQQTNPELATVNPGDSGHVAFSLVPRNLGTASNPITNPTITIAASVSGNRVQEANVPQALTASAGRVIRVSSAVALTGRVLRTIGPFANSGPIPPKAETLSTYTISWAVDNGTNPVSNARVTATLPAYVKWLNNVSPSGESVTYDPNSGIISWNIGNIAANTALTSRRREVYFQVGLEPGVNLVGQMPDLINQATLTTKDNFTGQELDSTQEIMSTRYSTDPAYVEGNGIVTQ